MLDYEELVNSLKNCVNIPCNEAQKEKCLAGRENDCRRELMAIAADAIEELVSNADKFKWISVEERLPNVDKTKSGYESVVVIAKIKGYVRSKALIYERACPRGKIVYRWKWMWDTIYDGPAVTHWMPLPATQKEEDGNA